MANLYLDRSFVPNEEGYRRLSSLVAYTRHILGIDLTLDLLAPNLGATAPELWDVFETKGTREWFVTVVIRNIVRGETPNAQGKPYDSWYYNSGWEKLIGLCREPELKELLESRRGSKALAARLFGSDVATLTVRIIGGVDYCQCRNTPFQGLAADGAKLALWRLLREGFLVSGFVHDEVLIELPDEGGYVSLAVVDRVRALMCESMASVLFGGIPVGCTATLSRCWSKDAELDVRGDRVYPWQPGSS